MSTKKTAAREEATAFVVRVRCVSANLQNGGDKANEVTMFRFATAEGHKPEHGASWFEGGIVVHTKEHGKYQVGSEYDLKVEV